MSSLGKLHRSVGSFTLVVFLLSGAYLKLRAHPERLADGPHLMFVSRHIYILANALVHLALAAYVSPLPTRGARTAQWVGSGLLSLSSVLLIGAFVCEPIGGRARTPVSAFGLYTLAAGVLLHCMIGMRRRARG